MVVGAEVDAWVMGLRLIRLAARIEVVPAEPLSETFPAESPGPAASLGPVARHDSVAVGSHLALAGLLLAEADDTLEDVRRAHRQIALLAGGSTGLPAARVGSVSRHGEQSAT